MAPGIWAILLFLLLLAGCTEKDSTPSALSSPPSDTSSGDPRRDLPPPPPPQTSVPDDRENPRDPSPSEPPAPPPGQTPPPEPPPKPSTPPPQSSPASPTIVPPAERESILVLVNAERRLPQGYRPPDLVRVSVRSAWGDERALLRREAAQAVEALFRDAQAAGFHPLLVSGFRSYELQATLYGNRAEEPHIYGVAPPGASEHQTGLAADILEEGRGMDATFANTPFGQWLAAHAPEYGFVLRYPRGKEHVTRVVFEPWHFRYVGREEALEMARTGEVLEEYLARRAPVSGRAP
ncbi:MAG: M15 family metallopeptidase [Brockia lithotrophica]|nr:M15 family metallopeptidase [Brockia lithotrophica]